MSIFKDIPVLVTGAEGFIGSHLARRLVREGARVSALVYPEASLRRLDEIKDRIKIFSRDIRDGEGLSEVVAEVEPQKVFHLAALTDVGRSWKKLDQALAVNVGGTLNLLKALDRVDYEVLITTCSGEVYGSNPPPFREDMPLEPVSPYSFSKAAATLLCRMSAATLGAPVLVLRLFLVYGPGQGRERFLPQLIESALSGQPFRMTAGEQVREYTYIDDVMEGFLLAAGRGEKGGEVFNLGSGEEITLRKLVEKVNKLLEGKADLSPEVLPYRKNEIWRLIGDHSKALRELGWRARTDLAQGLRRTVDWYREKFPAGL